MKTAMTFDQIVGLADGLSLLQKESLVEILTKRLMEQRRKVLQKDILETNREFKARKCRSITPASLMKEILAHLYRRRPWARLTSRDNCKTLSGKKGSAPRGIMILNLCIWPAR
jgi:hypothetical protein